MANKPKSVVYDENSIKELNFPENVQTRPTMYIGELGTNGKVHLIKEIIDNAVDEAMNGYGTKIGIQVSVKNNSFSVIDEGRGIPPLAIVKAFTKLHSSGKFDKGSYSVSGGLNGVGGSCVNALSTNMVVQTYHDGIEYVQKFKNGRVNGKLIENDISKKTNYKKRGSIVSATINNEIMGDEPIDIEIIKEELNMKAYINAGIEFTFLDVDNVVSTKFYHKNGIIDYISDSSKNLIFQPIMFSYTDEIQLKGIDSDANNKVEIDIALSYSATSNEENIKSFCNSLYTVAEGTHVVGFRIALANVIKKYIKDKDLLPKRNANLPISGEDTRAGLIAIVSIKHPNPLYSAQIKGKLTNTDAQGSVSKAVNTKFAEFLEENPKIAKDICNKVIFSAKQTDAANKAKENVGKKENSFSIVSDLGKLSNCVSRDISENEIFIVEGDSAGGSAKQGRDKRTQAIYALRGKPLNANNLTESKILENKEYADLVYILTGNRNGLNEKFDINKLKYGKVIIMADADVDGKHIQCLLNSFFYKHMKPIITEGRLYIAQPPLYSIIQNGKKRYFLDDEEYNNYIIERMSKLFTIKIDDIKVINFKVFNKDCQIYINNLDSIAFDYNIDEQLIEEFAIKHYTDGMTAQEFYNILSKVFKLKGTRNADKSITVQGIYKSERYVSFKLSDFIKAIKTFAENSKIFYTSIEYEYNGQTYTDKLLYELYNFIIDKTTPKSRSRLKG